MRKSFIVDEDFNDSRLDRWFKQKVINLPHSLIEKIINQAQNYLSRTGILILEVGNNKRIIEKKFKKMKKS